MPLKAPEKEPRLDAAAGAGGASRRRCAVSKTFAARRGPVAALDDVTFARAHPARRSGSWARRAAASRRCSRWSAASSAPTPAWSTSRARARGAPRALRPDAAARPAAALAVGPRQRRAARSSCQGCAARRGAPRVRRRCSSASGWPSSPARGHTSSRAACASASRSLRTLLAGKPVLLLDEPFGSLDSITRAELQEWLAAALARRAAHDAARHPRRRGGALPLRPGARAVAPARPRPRRELRTGPRPLRARARETVTSPRVLRAAPARAGGAGVSVGVRDWLPPLAAAGARRRRLGGARAARAGRGLPAARAERGRARAGGGPRRPARRTPG